MEHAQLLAAVLARPWAMERQHAQAFLRLAAARIAGTKATQADIIEAKAARRSDEIAVVDGVAILPMNGPIFPKANLMTESSGATACSVFASQFEELTRREEVRAIVMDVDSPGGSTAGVAEAAARIRTAKIESGKTVAAVSNYMMASAAYYLASQADEIVSSPSSLTGSVGVYAVHEDMSAALEAAGIDTTIVRAGEGKAEFNPFEPLSEADQQALQALVDHDYAMFVRDVAEGRGVSEETVRGYTGRAFNSDEALRRGIADRVGTISETVARLSSPQARGGTKRRRRVSAEDIATEVVANLKEGRNGRTDD